MMPLEIVLSRLARPKKCGPQYIAVAPLTQTRSPASRFARATMAACSCTASPAARPRTSSLPSASPVRPLPGQRQVRGGEEMTVTPERPQLPTR